MAQRFAERDNDHSESPRARLDGLIAAGDQVLIPHHSAGRDLASLRPAGKESFRSRVVTRIMLARRPACQRVPREAV
jgi:hypothetical protein